jgi:DNA repair exonuclease SbcCD ATPase subunit
MTAPDAPVSLIEVRQRFIEAESSLASLAQALESLRSSSERFDEARTDLGRTHSQLVGLADVLGKGGEALMGSIAALKDGVGFFERTDPARLLSEIERVRSLLEEASGERSAIERRMETTFKTFADSVETVRGEASAAEARLITVLSSQLQTVSTSLDALGARARELATASDLASGHARTDAMLSSMAQQHDKASQSQVGLTTSLGGQIESVSRSLNAIASRLEATHVEDRTWKKRILGALVGIGLLLAALNAWPLLR